MKDQIDDAMQEPLRVWHLVVVLAVIGVALALLSGCVPPGTNEPDVGPYARQRWTSLQQDVEAAKAKVEAEQKANRHTYRQQRYSENQDEFRTRRYDGKFTDRRWQELYLDRVDDERGTI